MLKSGVGFLLEFRAGKVRDQLLLPALLAEVHLGTMRRASFRRGITMKALDATTPCSWLQDIRVDVLRCRAASVCRHERFPLLFLLAYTAWPLLVGKSRLAPFPVCLDRIPSGFELILRHFASEHLEEQLRALQRPLREEGRRKGLREEDFVGGRDPGKHNVALQRVLLWSFHGALANKKTKELLFGIGVIFKSSFDSPTTKLKMFLSHV